MTDGISPIHEVTGPSSGTINNYNNSARPTAETAFVAENNSGELTTIESGKRTLFSRPKRVYRVDLTWHSLIATVIPEDGDRFAKTPVQVRLSWRVSDAVEAVREGTHDVPAIIHDFLYASLRRAAEEFQGFDIAAMEWTVARRLELSWQHPALEARDFRVTLGPHNKQEPHDLDEQRHQRVMGRAELREFALRAESIEGSEIAELLDRHQKEARLNLLSELGNRGHLDTGKSDLSIVVQKILWETGEIPVSIYLSQETIHEQVETAVEHTLRAAGLEVSRRDDPIIGSWFRNIKARLRNFARTPLGQEATVLALHAAKNNLVHMQEAEIAAKLLENVGPVIESLQNTDEAVIRVGAILIVKDDGAVSVNQLTPSQQLLLFYKPQLLKTPRDVLVALEAFREPSPEHPAGDSGVSMRALGNGHEPPSTPPAIS